MPASWVNTALPTMLLLAATGRPEALAAGALSRRGEAASRHAGRRGRGASHASSPLAVPTEDLLTEEISYSTPAENRSLILFDKGDHVTVQAGDEGFRFRYPKLEAALAAIFG